MSPKFSALLMICLLAIVAGGEIWLDASHTWLAAAVAILIAALFFWQSWVQTRTLKNFEQRFIETSLRGKGSALAATLDDLEGTESIMREAVAEATLLQELLEKIPLSDPLIEMVKTNSLPFTSEPVVSIPQKKPHFLKLHLPLPTPTLPEAQELLLFHTIRYWRKVQSTYASSGFIIHFPKTISTAFCERLYAHMSRTHYPTQQLVLCLETQNLSDFDAHYSHLARHGVRLMLKISDFELLMEHILLPRCLSFLSLSETLIQNLYTHQGLERLRLWQEQGCHIVVTGVLQESVLSNLTPLVCDYATGPAFGGRQIIEDGL